MKVNDAVLAMAGFLILLSLALGSTISAFFVNENWLWLTAFVGLNLFQSAFTGFCPAAMIFKN